MRANDLRFAFGIEGFIDGELKDSESYVKYLVRMWGKRDGVAYEQLLEYHRCNTEDFEKFA